MVPQGDEVRSHSIRSAPKELPPHLASPLLKVPAWDRIGKAVSTLNDQLNSEPRAHCANELFIAIRLDAANPMVQMRSHDSDSKPLAKPEQRGCKRNRIGPTRKPDQYRSASTHIGPHQRRLDSANDSLFNVASHD
jgi:hypothetical protein